jgi:hypothetical protein
LVKEEKKVLFPEYSKGTEVKQIRKIVSGRFNDFPDLNARADGIDGRTKHIEILENQPHRNPPIIEK